MVMYENSSVKQRTCEKETFKSNKHPHSVFFLILAKGSRILTNFGFFLLHQNLLNVLTVTLVNSGKQSKGEWQQVNSQFKQRY